MNPAWRFNILGHVVTLPLVVLALLYAVIVARARSWKWQNGCLTFVAGTKLVGDWRVSRLWGNPGGQCWCAVIGFASETQRDREDLQVHERCHVVQSQLTASIVTLGTVGSFVAAGWSPITGAILGSLFGCVAFGVVYLACFLRHWLVDEAGEEPGWHDDYRKNVLESQAYRKQWEFQNGDGNRWGT